MARPSWLGVLRARFLEGRPSGTVRRARRVQLQVERLEARDLLAYSPTTAFAPPVTTASGVSSSYQLTVADFNRDGKLDVAVAAYQTSQVSVLLGNGAGGFAVAAGSPFAAGTNPNAIAAADFNKDNNPDLVTANFGNNTVSIFLGDGNGGFGVGVPLPVGSNPTGLAIGDFNNDTNLDIAVANFGSSDITLLLGDGTGVFTPAAGSPFAGGAGGFFAAVANFNADANLDLVKANYPNATVSVLLGDGNGSLSLTASSPFSAGGAQAVSPTVGDFDNDGDTDLAIANFGSGDVSVLLGNGNGNFAVPTTYATGVNPYQVVNADFNGDGNLDLAVVNNMSRTLTILHGQGDGTFLNYVAISLPSNPTAVVAGDLNNDGAPDLLVGFYPFSNNVLVFLNHSATQISLTAGSPNPGVYGDNVSFTVTVTAALPSAPQPSTGSVTFYDGATPIGTAPVDAAGQATLVTSFTSLGDHSITASYADDSAFFRPSTSAAIIETIQAATSTSATSTTATFNTASQDVTFSASVTSLAGAVNEGTITFTLFNSSNVQVGTATTSTTLSGGSASVSYALPAGTPAGSYTIQAVYNPGPNFLDSSDTSQTLNINPAASTTSATAATTTFSTGSQAVTLTVSVTSPAGVVNQGTVTFTVFDSNVRVGSPTTSATVSGGTASVSYMLPAGTPAATYTIQAVYNPSPNFLGSSDSNQNLTINRADTSIAAVSTTTSYAVNSHTVTLTAFVASAAGNVNEGTVTFALFDSDNLQVGSATTSATVSNGNANVSYLLPAGTPVGSYSIRATYHPGPNYNGNSDNAKSLTVTPASTTTTPGAVTVTFNTGSQSVALSAVVTSGAGSMNEGTVTFTLFDSGNVQVGTSVTLGMISNGSALVMYPLPAGAAAGSYTLRAVYNPGPNFATSNGSNVLTIGKASTRITAKMTPILFAATGVLESLAAAVTSAAGTVNGGIVTFTIYNASTGLPIATLRATVSGGRARTRIRLRPGTYFYRARYSGTADFMASTFRSRAFALLGRKPF